MLTIHTENFKKQEVFELFKAKTVSEGSSNDFAYLLNVHLAALDRDLFSFTNRNYVIDERDGFYLYLVETPKLERKARVPASKK